MKNEVESNLLMNSLEEFGEMDNMKEQKVMDNMATLRFISCMMEDKLIEVMGREDYLHFSTEIFRALQVTDLVAREKNKKDDFTKMLRGFIKPTKEEELRAKKFIEGGRY